MAPRGKVLVRLVTSRSPWRQGRDPETRIDAQRTFKLRPGETGISFWDISDAERKRVVMTGLACGRVVRASAVEHIDYIAVDESILGQFGRVFKTAGFSPFSPANDHHYELKCTPEQAIELAEFLFDAEVIEERFRKENQLQLLRELVSDDLSPEDYAKVRSLLERSRARKKGKE